MAELILHVVEVIQVVGPPPRQVLAQPSLTVVVPPRLHRGTSPASQTQCLPEEEGLSQTRIGGGAPRQPAQHWPGDPTRLDDDDALRRAQPALPFPRW